MFDVLITTTFSTVHGCSVHTTISSHGDYDSAVDTAHIINSSSKNTRVRSYGQTALCLFETTGGQ
jgi:hypothetical protein